MRVAKGSTISGDAGHNCYPDEGATGIRSEDNCTKAVWNLIMDKLNKSGYKTKDCTPWQINFNSAGASQGYRVKLANQSNSSLHLCIHFNKGGGRGVECWISELGGRSEKFAYQICEEIFKLGYVNRGVKQGRLYITDYTNMPTVLVECCFIDSKEDMERYDPDAIAKAIVKAITGEVVEAREYNFNCSTEDEKYNELELQLERENKINNLNKRYSSCWRDRKSYITNEKWISYSRCRKKSMTRAL